MFKKIHHIISPSDLFKLLFSFTFLIQLIIISFNHFSGYSNIESFYHFFSKLNWGIALSLVGGYTLAYPDLLLINYLNKSFEWNCRALSRVLIQLLYGMFIGSMVSVPLTVLSNIIGAYKEDFYEVLATNALLFGVANVLLLIIFEAWIFFKEGTRSKKESESLEKELSYTRFEVLKNQIDPHFMFNSLNVLSSLIDKDTDQAQRFIDEFSRIYRYVLQSIDEPLVPLRKEVEFAKSYIFLHQLRYGTGLEFSVNIAAKFLHFSLPPLSLQVVLENVLKHNLINKDKPLKISITCEDESLKIINNVQLKRSGNLSMGIGQKNLANRYVLLTDQEPVFRFGGNYYEVILPLINEEHHESFDY